LQSRKPWAFPVSVQLQACPTLGAGTLPKKMRSSSMTVGATAIFITWRSKAAPTDSCHKAASAMGAASRADILQAWFQHNWPRKSHAKHP
jgi:hypothetical protein